MATKKDLVEAHAFSRRRLVTAFLSGAPGGREVEPSRPGRTIVGGLALALLVVAAGAILAALVGRTQEGWDQQTGLVLGKDRGDLYAVLRPRSENVDPELRPVLNPVSGRLIFGSKAPTVVSDEVLSGITPGDELGIEGAPRRVPEPDHLVESGWTACIDDRERRLTATIFSDPQVSPLRDQAFLFTGEDGTLYLIATSEDRPGDEPAQAYRYVVPQNDGTDDLLDALGLTGAASISVPAAPDAWLRLFPGGGKLGPSSFDTDGLGGPVVDPSPDLQGENAHYGDYVVTSDFTYVLVPGGRVQLAPFAAAIYLAYPPTGAKQLSLDSPPLGNNLSGLEKDNHWPEARVGRFTEENACAVLVSPQDLGQDGDGALQVQMAHAPTGDSLPVEGQPALIPQQLVEPGYGAFVYEGAFGATEGGSPVVISPNGQAYPIEGEQALVNLGYTMRVPVVPAPWIRLFPQDGAGDDVILSYDRALCPPDLRPGDTCASVEG